MCDKHICLRIGWNNWSFIIVKAKICRFFVVCVCVLFYESKVFIKAFLLLHFILTFFWCLNTCMPSVCKYTFGPSEAAFSLRGDRMSCPLCRCMDTIGILPQTHLNYTHTHTHTHTEDERAITSSSLALGKEPWAHWPLGDVGSLHHWQQPGAGSKRGSRVWSGACVSWSLLRIIAKWHTGQSGGSGTAWCSAVTQTTPGQSTAAITHYEATHDFKNNNYWTCGSV